MANPFVKAWKYLMALFSSKVDEYADPKVQIQQAIEEAQRQHQALTQQAAQVIGNQRQLEMRLNRQLADIEKLQANVRQALTLADQATAAGDVAKATEYNNAAEAFAAQLVTAEQSVEDLKGLHDQSLQAATQAKKAVEQNAMVLQQKIAERTKLLSQLEQAKMQEQVSASLRSMTEIAAPGNTPSLDEVRANDLGVRLYKIGSMYFVIDGHHRVSIAIARHQDTIDAYVTLIHTRISPEGITATSDLVLKDHRRIFLSRVPLEGSQAEAIRLSFPFDYAELADRLIACGELMSTRLFTELLHQRGVKAQWQDARQLLRTDSQAFIDATEARRNRRDSWYVRPAGHIDLCNVPLPVREAKR